MFNLKEKFLSLFGKKIKVIYLNGVITITLLSKKQLVFSGNKEDYETVSKFTTDEEVQEYYDDWLLNYTHPTTSTSQDNNVTRTKQKEVERVVEKKEYKKIEKNFDKLLSTGDFKIVDGELYLKPIELSIPKLLVQKFLDIIDSVLEGENEDDFEKYHALKNFWKWCSLCHNPQSREDLFRYLEVQGLEVNKFGFFFAYRKVVKVRENKQNAELVKFITQSYIKIKGQKKSPKNFDVFEDLSTHELFISHQKNCNTVAKTTGHNTFMIVGNLMDLYNNLGSSEVQEQMFTDDRTHSMDIRIGREVSLPPEECDTDRNRDCSSGLTCSPFQK